jgi:serine/threonine protein phosphatase PrpC
MFVHASAEASSRRRSEDRVVILVSGDVHVIVVADGAGGCAGGAAAAEAFVEAITDHVHERRELCEPTWLPRAFEDVDAALASKMIGETTGSSS